MITIRLSMNGESPMMVPGLGVPQRRARDHRQERDRRRRRRACRAGVAQAARLVLGRDLCARVLPSSSSALGRVPGSEAALDELRGDEREHDRDEDRRADAEVQVRGDVDVSASAGRARRPVVRDLRQHAVERRDQEVHAEARRDACEGGGDAGERMAADAQERRGPEGYQHEVAGIGGDARDDAEQDDDERQRCCLTRRRRACVSAPRSVRRPRPGRRRSSPPG